MIKLFVLMVSVTQF